MISTEIKLELQKMKVTRPLLLAVLGATTVFILSTFSLWFGIDEVDSKHIFLSTLLSEAFVSSLVLPIVVAVIASRQAEVEHSSRGWMFLVSSGSSLGRIFNAKFIVGSTAIFAAVVFQAVLVAALCLAIGDSRDFPTLPWLLFHFLLFLVVSVYYTFFLYLSCRLNNQVVNVAAGVVLSFLSMFAFLGARSVVVFLPWGYFAAITPVQQLDGEIVLQQVNMLSIICFLTAGILLAWYCHRAIAIWK